MCIDVAFSIVSVYVKARQGENVKFSDPSPTRVMSTRPFHCEKLLSGLQ